MKKEYDVIYIGGNIYGGRVIAGFRLRTELQKHGYQMLVIESAAVMSTTEFKSLLDNVITEKTIVIGFSMMWLGGFGDKGHEWCTDEFFQQLKTEYPNIKLVGGGPTKKCMVRKSEIIYENCDWIFSGFSDDSFPRFLNYLNKKSNHGFKYFIEEGKRVISGNKLFPLKTPDDIATVFEPEDNFLPYQPIPLEVSRGCIFKCTFCHHPFQAITDPDKYIRTPKNLAEELKRNYDMFGTYRYFIMDDTFNDSMEKLDRLHCAIDIAKLPNFEFVSYIKPELLVTKPQMIPKLIQMGLASGIVGMESLKKETRKSIGKGMDAYKILDVIANMRSNSKVTFYSGFIVGLPYESLDEVQKTQEFLIENRDTLFSAWQWLGLGITKNGISELDKNPEKHGYTVLGENVNNFINWKNDYTNNIEAHEYANQLCTDGNKYCLTSGYDLPHAWHLNIPTEEIAKTTSYQFEYYSKGVASMRKMAKATLAKFNVGILAPLPKSH